MFPDTVTLDPLGVLTFGVLGVTTTGDSIPVDVQWSSSAGSISSSGRFIADSTESDVDVTATLTGSPLSGNAKVRKYKVVKVIVRPHLVSLLPGQLQQFTTLGVRDRGDTVVVSPNYTVITGAGSVGSGGIVTANGLFTAGAMPGSFLVIARRQAMADTALVTIAPAPVASVSVSPATQTLQVGGSSLLTAILRDASGNILIGRSVTWTSSAPGVASVSVNGEVTALAIGSATITATSEGRSGSASVSVSGAVVPVASVSVTPTPATLRVGTTAQLSATTRDSAGNVLGGRVVTWSSSAPAVATVSASGLVTAVGAGAATITATSEGKSGTSAITVTVVPVATVTVTPPSGSVIVAGTYQLGAVTKDSAGNVLSGRSVTWSSSAPAVATVSAGGLVTGMSAGNATITATSEGKSGTASVVVTAPPPPGTRAGYYVAPNGSSSNNGSASGPWTLAYALGGAGGRIRAGDTVWVRGGTYYAPFRSTLTGTAAAPIVVRAYPGERAIIDGVNASGDNFVVAGSWSVMWGLEFTSTATSRYADVINHNHRPNNVINNGPHNKYINIVIHDGGVAFFNYSTEWDVEVYGSIIYNNGWEAPDRGHGHALYLKSDVGPVVARDNVIFNQYGYGIHAYTNTGSGLLNNIHLEGNVSFNNGSLSPSGTSANIGNLGQPLASGLDVLDNMTYFAPSLSGSNLVLGSGDGLLARGNYVVGGSGISQGSWTNATVTSNTVLSATASTPTKVFVRPNAFEVGRANIIVYNPGGQASITADLSAVVPVGVRYEVRNVQDLFGAPVASGTYGGGAVSLPMSGIRPQTPTGLSSSPAPTTGPYFNVFLVTIVTQ